ncbi:MAG: D-alanyl-D-alanine carboxypeptidase, partial [Alphaproteobacteria bacterium GM7ARS4]|nr:D-alanyl-D-alanine carboxypeptidase [Alphaproteobacteria bacterium GM7ARS4]
TLYIIFERLATKQWTLDERLTVSERAWRHKGSRMFLEVGHSATIEDLVRGIIVQSGNDACIVIAEAISGHERVFARHMTEKARALGLTKSHFTNSTGWHDEGHVTTAEDVAHLARALIRDFPQYYHYFRQRAFRYNAIWQHNRNELLGHYGGADGLKTGYTLKAGYSLVASAQRQGRRLILVLSGIRHEDDRLREARRLLDWGFKQLELSSPCCP